MKLRVILASGSITLPTDWNPANNRVWLWGAGGRGAHDAEVGLFSSGGGGGGGGFTEVTNVGSPGDVWTYQVGAGSGSRGSANATWVKDALLAYVGYAESGENANVVSGGFFGGGGRGGSGDSVAGSNSGGTGDANGGGGGGGSSAGPKFALGTKGGGHSLSERGGAGGGGAVGDFATPLDSSAVNGFDPLTNEGATGGYGYYGIGAGSGGLVEGVPGSDGVANTGGGGGGGYGPGGGTNRGSNGGSGANWEFILTLSADTWLASPFSITEPGSGHYAALSNGTVPGGGGGGGGGAFGGNGGNGGFPGGGGGGASDSWGELAVAGDGADGLIILMYDDISDAGETGEEDECGGEDEADEPQTAITFPKCDLVPASINVEVVSSTVSPGRSFTSREVVVQPDAGRWRITLRDIPIRDRPDAFLWRQIASALNGRNNPILVPVYEAPLSGTPIAVTALHAHSIGATQLDLSQTAGADIRAGMHFWDGTWLYRVKRVVNENDALKTITIFPPLRAALTTSQSLDFNDPYCRCRLEADSGMDSTLGLLRFADQTVSFVEDV